jgi:transposase
MIIQLILLHSTLYQFTTEISSERIKETLVNSRERFSWKNVMHKILK